MVLCCTRIITSMQGKVLGMLVSLNTFNFPWEWNEWASPYLDPPHGNVEWMVSVLVSAGTIWLPFSPAHEFQKDQMTHEDTVLLKNCSIPKQILHTLQITGRGQKEAKGCLFRAVETSCHKFAWMQLPGQWTGANWWSEMSPDKGHDSSPPSPHHPKGKSTPGVGSIWPRHRATATLERLILLGLCSLSLFNHYRKGSKLPDMCDHHFAISDMAMCIFSGFSMSELIPSKPWVSDAMQRNLKIHALS